MMRLIGAALVASGCAWLGFQAAAELRRRVRILRGLGEGLAVLERELELTAPPLPQLLERAAAHSTGPARQLFQGCGQQLPRLEEERFSALWRGQVGRLKGLNQEGRAVLDALGDILGRYDSQAQREGVAAARRRLEQLADQEESERRRRGRVYQALGLSGGAFLVILLL